MGKTEENYRLFTNSVKLSDRLRKARELRGLSAAYVAKQINRAGATISLWESGKRTPGIEDLKKLCSIYDCTMDFLAGRSDDPGLSADEYKRARFAALEKEEALCFAKDIRDINDLFLVCLPKTHIKQTSENDCILIHMEKQVPLTRDQFNAITGGIYNALENIIEMACRIY